MLPLLTIDEIHDLIDGAWMIHGSCTWTPEVDIDEASDDDMKVVCSTCIVRGHCLAYGLLIDARHYVYGGCTPAERRAYDNGQRYSQCTQPDCGRGFVWQRSGNAKTPGVCEACNSTERLSTHYTYGGPTSA